MKKRIKTFIEITPTYPLPVSIYEKEDYFTWPVKMMQDKGYVCSIFTIIGRNQKSEEYVNSILVKRFNNPVNLLLELSRQNPDIVYAQGKSFVSFVGLFSRKAIYTPHGSYGVQHPLYIKNLILRRITKFLWGNFNKVICITPYEASVYERFNFNKNYVIIPNAIDYSFFSKPYGKENFLNRYNLSKNNKIILFVGNIHGNVKNINILYKAFKLVTKKVKEAKLVLIGKILDQDFQTKELIKIMKKDKSVRIIGWLSHRDLIKALDSASCFVNTSMNEGHSLAVAEGASAGIPLCLSKIGTFTSIFKNSALYHQPNDYKTLAQNIIYYLENRRIAKQHSIMSQSIIKNNYSLTIIKEKMWNVFLSVLK